jgi:hypothetical protein
LLLLLRHAELLHGLELPLHWRDHQALGRLTDLCVVAYAAPKFAIDLLYDTTELSLLMAAMP